MNPRDYRDTNSYYNYNNECEALERMHDLIMEQQKKNYDLESQLRAERTAHSTKAYDDLCAALGVTSLNAVVENGTVKIAAADLEVITARIQSLKTNVLSEGAL